MDYNQKILVNLLSAAIRKKSIPIPDYKNINLNKIYKNARSHEVYELLYPLVKVLYGQNDAYKKLISEWCRMSVLSSVHQIIHIKQMGKIFNSFNHCSIPVIALKGLVLRELYPHPELRSMGDADILVHKEDITRSRQLLEKLGYIESGSNPVHIHFNHEKYPPIELHWALVNEKHIKTAADFQDKLWENTIWVNIAGEKVLALSAENQLMHICLHMAVHFTYRGFGLRQLCDLVLMIEYTKDSIDWYLFYESCKSYGIHTFVTAIFTVCSILFGIDLPSTLYLSPPSDSYYISLLIQDIFSEGVYGKDNITEINADSLLCRQNHKKWTTSRSKFFLELSFLFPPSKKLNERYSYAKKFCFLTPIAWIHRLFFSIFHYNLNFIKYISDFYSSIPISQKHHEVICWLNLK